MNKFVITVLSLYFVCVGVFGAFITKPQRTAAPTTTAATTAAPAKSTFNYKRLKVVATAYCPCKKCSEGYGRQTATGVTAQQGRTIAVDPSVIPYGTRVLINGKIYVAEDCGGAIKGNRIDIFFNSHADADNFGRQEIEIYIIK